ncbi:MAG: hypothetical protein IKV41_00135 [Oscillospiraceae bacterium]|nr:hypothetical protein [Oscillospiraceae bacterium]
MAIEKTNVIDGMTPEDNGKCLKMVIYDYFEWSEIIETEHLIMLRDKLNSYATYWEEREFENISKYNGFDFDYAVIEYHTLHAPSEKAIAFLSYAQKQLREANILIGSIFVGDADNAVRYDLVSEE